MELDNLKDIWNQVGSEPLQPGNNEKLKEMLNKSSRSPIARMKKNIMWELITVIVAFGGVAVYYLFAFNGKFVAVSVMYTALSVFFIVYFYYKNKLLSEMQCNACMVKANLEKQVHTLERYVRFYLIAGTAIVPVLLIFLWILLYGKLPGIYKDSRFFPSASVSIFKSDLVWLLIIVVFTILIYYANKWYVHKLYGQHINKLKNVLAEMQEE
jgi:hypothetical protein